jgi:hypothetical protein
MAGRTVTASIRTAEATRAVRDVALMVRAVDVLSVPATATVSTVFRV